jgi:hypothetical protein
MPPQGKSVPPLKALGARYKLGAPVRPVSIVFDNGFLDKFKPSSPLRNADFGTGPGKVRS